MVSLEKNIYLNFSSVFKALSHATVSFAFISLKRHIASPSCFTYLFSLPDFYHHYHPAASQFLNGTSNFSCSSHFSVFLKSVFYSMDQVLRHDLRSILLYLFCFFPKCLRKVYQLLGVYKKDLLKFCSTFVLFFIPTMWYVFRFINLSWRVVFHC